VEQVNRVLTAKELEAIRRSRERGQPYGNEAWVKRAAGQLGLASTLRSRGRPKKDKKGS
jgi:putative transposase